MGFNTFQYAYQRAPNAGSALILYSIRGHFPKNDTPGKPPGQFLVWMEKGTNSPDAKEELP